MRFFSTVFAAAALVSAALAQPAITKIEPSGDFEVGKTYTISYTATAPITLKLRQGPSTDLQDVAVLTSSASAGSFQWTVDKSLPNGSNYALQIVDSTGNNYWGPITVSGSTAQASSSAVSSSASASASASASSSASASKSAVTTLSTTLSTLTSSVSGSAAHSASSNGTISSATLSATGSKTSASATGSKTSTASATGSSGAPQSTGAASQMGSSMALVLGAVAAMAYLN